MNVVVDSVYWVGYLVWFVVGYLISLVPLLFWLVFFSRMFSTICLWISKLGIGILMFFRTVSEILCDISPLVYTSMRSKNRHVLKR